MVDAVLVNPHNRLTSVVAGLEGGAPLLELLPLELSGGWMGNGGVSGRVVGRYVNMALDLVCRCSLCAVVRPLIIAGSEA